MSEFEFHAVGLRGNYAFWQALSFIGRGVKFWGSLKIV